ncbi:MAG: hypothetical protein ACK2T0_14465, partial [Anaerolineales bacterium]
QCVILVRSLSEPVTSSECAPAPEAIDAFPATVVSSNHIVLVPAPAMEILPTPVSDIKANRIIQYCERVLLQEQFRQLVVDELALEAQQAIPDYLRHRLEMQKGHLGTIEQELGNEVLAYVPEMERDITGLAMIEKMANEMFGG